MKLNSSVLKAYDGWPNDIQIAEIFILGISSGGKIEPDNKLKRDEIGTWSGSGTAASRPAISLSKVLLNDVADKKKYKLRKGIEHEITKWWKIKLEKDVTRQH